MSVIDFETANMMFDEFADNWYIKTDTSKFKEKEVEEFNLAKEKIVDSIMEGRFEIIDKVTIEYKFKVPEEAGIDSIKMRRPRGSTYMQTDSGGKDESMKKTFLMLSEMTGKNNAFYSKVSAVDIKILIAITTLFFGS